MINYINVDKITISRLDKIGPVTVGHITGSVTDICRWGSPISEGALEIPISMHFVHREKNNNR